MGIRARLREKAFRLLDEVVAARQAELRAQLVTELSDALRREGDRLVAEARVIEIRHRRDMYAAGERDAAVAGARFVRDAMPKATSFPHPHATLEYGLKLAPSGGMALEFGVYTGATLAMISAARSGDVYGFDSFEGLPETWRTGFTAGTFDVARPPEVPGAELVVGWFCDTLPGFLATHPGAVDFVHLDADLYSSTRTVLELVGPRLRPGSVLVFDEYLNYPGWERHEHRAWQEYVTEHDVAFRYEAYTHDNEQVVVRLT